MLASHASAEIGLPPRQIAALQFGIDTGGRSRSRRRMGASIAMTSDGLHCSKSSRTEIDLSHGAACAGDQHICAKCLWEYAAYHRALIRQGSCLESGLELSPRANRVRRRTTEPQCLDLIPSRTAFVVAWRPTMFAAVSSVFPSARAPYVACTNRLLPLGAVSRMRRPEQQSSATSRYCYHQRSHDRSDVARQRRCVVATGIIRPVVQGSPRSRRQTNPTLSLQSRRRGTYKSSATGRDPGQRYFRPVVVPKASSLQLIGGCVRQTRIRLDEPTIGGVCVVAGPH